MGSQGGTGNIAIGSNTLFQAWNLTNYNTVMGWSAMPNGGGAGNNVAIGALALGGQSISLSSSQGVDNTGVGANSGLTNQTGSNNTFVGFGADAASSNLNNVTAIGNGASVGSSNTIQLGNTGVTLVNTSGAVNTAIGYRVGGAAPTGNYLRGNGSNFVSSGIQAADVPTLNQNTTGTAGDFTGSLSGDVTGGQGSTVVSTAAGNDIVAALNNVSTTSAISVPVSISTTGTHGITSAGTLTASTGLTVSAGSIRLSYDHSSSTAPTPDATVFQLDASAGATITMPTEADGVIFYIVNKSGSGASDTGATFTIPSGVTWGFVGAGGSWNHIQ
jgi:hypothetical protein